MTAKQQIQRIQRILSNVEMTTCTNRECNLNYLPLKECYENECPKCHTKYVDEFIPEEECDYISHDEIESLINL